MTVEDCRTILKVHIRAAESCEKMEGAFALFEALTAIDNQIAGQILNPNHPPGIFPTSGSAGVDARKD